MEKKDMTAVIARCLNGDSMAQEELVLAVQNRVYYHCRKMLKDEDRAFDLTQDVLMAMLTKLDTLQNPERFWSWLGGITANLCRNAINRGPREEQFYEDEEGNSIQDTLETLDEQAIPDKALDNSETRRMIAELVDALPDAQRQCVLLFYYDEMSVKDIAASLDVSENTIKSRLNYARKSIKEGVERFEKQGIKLYSLSPLPFLLFFLGQDAKACSMTAEQAARMAHQVVQGASAAAAGTGAVTVAANAAAGGSTAGAAGGSAAATAAKTATAAAGKGLLGLSTKAIAGTVAGLVLAGGITGGVLLGGEKDAGSPPVNTEHISATTEQTSMDAAQEPQDDGRDTMAYVALPEWVDVSYDQVGTYFFENAVMGEVAETSTYLDCWYGTPEGEFLFSLSADLASKQIFSLGIKAKDRPAQSIGWLDITLGDSYQSVLTKLGLAEVPSDRNNIICYFYETAPDENFYTALASPTYGTRSELLLWYHRDRASDYRVQIMFKFDNDQLCEFGYYRNRSEFSQPSEEEYEPSGGGSGDGMVISNISDTTIEVGGREQGYVDDFIGGGQEYTTTMEHIELPEWIDTPYEEIGHYFLTDPHFSEYEPRLILWEGVPKFCDWRPAEDTMCRLLSPLNIEFLDGSEEILTLSVSNTTYEDIPISIGWLDAFTGDSFGSILDKLGLHDFPINTERVEVYFNPGTSAEGRCSYYTTSDDTAAPPYQEIALYYGDTPVCFLFSEGTLFFFTYGYYPA